MIKHTFKTKAHDLKGLFKEVTTLKGFMKNLDRQSKINPDNYPINKYLGDGFEFFVELFLKLNPTDNRIGIYNYIPILVNDNGVDGIGLNIRGEKCTIQVKYRGDVTNSLCANKDSLSNFVATSQIKEGVSVDKNNPKNKRLFIFTTAKGLNHYTDEKMYEGHVKCIGYKYFKAYLDNNLSFWNQARELLENGI